MAFILSQENCQIKVHSPLGDKKLFVDEFYAEEVLNDAYEFTSLVHSPDSDIDFASLLGKNVSVEISSGSKSRFFSGIVGKAEHIKTLYIEKNKEIAFYQLKIYPKFWLLKFSKDHRIYQNKSASTIISELLKEKKVTDFSDETQGAGKTVRDYCVQYGESHFDFISRLMEEEGIFYYFTHELNVHKMILVDANTAAKPLSPEVIPYQVKASTITPYNTIHDLRIHEQITPKGSRVVDFDYEKPSTPLNQTDSGAGDGDIMYDYPGLFSKVADGDKIAKRLKNAHLWLKSGISGKSTTLNFSPFKSFTIKGHPRKAANKKHIIYRVKHRVFNQRITNENSLLPESENMDVVYENDFFGFPTDIEFKPTFSHPKNRINCSQTAIVTGPSGEEIFTDKFGRIKVKFHWDTRGTKDDKSSCWVRVAQNWAGSQWGGLVIPRIGMEVVVSFLDGDPDRPLVIGCVYNGDKLPPYASANPTRSTFKTDSSKGGGGFNELRFEDKKDAEEIYFHAQKDFNTYIIESRTEEIEKKNDTLTLDKGSKFVNIDGDGTKYQDKIKKGDRILDITEGNHEIKIKKGDQKITLTQGDQDIKIEKGDQKITITQGNLETKISTGNAQFKLGGGNLTIEITGNTTIKSTGNMNFESTGPMSLKSSAAVSIEAGASLSIKANAGVAIESQAACSIKANAALTMESKGVAKLAAEGMTSVEGAMLSLKGKAMATLEGAAMANVKGGLVKIN